GHAIGHGSAGGPMSEEIAVSLANLTPDDLHAVITYLRSVPVIHTSDLPDVKTSVASDSPKLIQASVDPRGKEIFEGACSSCHGWSGVGLLTQYATLTGARALNDPSAINVAQIVLSGERTHTAEGLVLMPAFGSAYSDTEIAAVTNYVTARFGGTASHLTARDVAALRRMTSN